MLNRIIFQGSILVLLCSLLVSEAHAQFGLGVKLGGNLSHANAFTFRSTSRLGFQVGGVLSYHFQPNMAIQTEPTFNITRVRANSQTVDEVDGISKGNKSLQFFDLPVLFRFDVARRFALLGGLEFNSLLNEDRHLVNNGEEAFKGGTRVGYSLGFELGKFYFRYRTVERQARIHRSWSPKIQQYQIGVKWDLF